MANKYKEENMKIKTRIHILEVRYTSIKIFNLL